MLNKTYTLYNVKYVNRMNKNWVIIGLFNTMKESI